VESVKGQGKRRRLAEDAELLAPFTMAIRKSCCGGASDLSCFIFVVFICRFAYHNSSEFRRQAQAFLHKITTHCVYT
jgi:hypothetical protein